MKQILLVLVLLAAALGGFFLVRTLKKPAVRPQTPGVVNPGTDGGAGGAGGAGANRNRNRPNTPSPGAGQNRKPITVVWKPFASPESVVPWDELWSLDFSQVDFDAPVLVRVGDVEITQSDFRRMFCLQYANAYNLARCSEAVARGLAAERGNEYMLTDELYDELLAYQAAQGGESLLERVSKLATQSVLPPTLARKTHQLMLASLVYNTVGGTVDDLSPLLLEAFKRFGGESTSIEDESGAPGVQFMSIDNIREVWTRLHSADEYDERNFDIRQLSGLTSLLGAVQQGLRNFDLGALTWSFLDAPMPDDVYLRIALAEVSKDEAARAPWKYGGDVVDVRVDEVWPYISENLDPDAEEEALRQLVWFKVLRADLEGRGLMPEPEESVRRFVEYHIAQSGTLFDSVFTASAEGFPTIHHYRAVVALRDAFSKSLPDGWDSPEVQRPFYVKNRFFIERWNPSLDFAYFPALRWVPLDDGSVQWNRDWDAALADAQNARGRAKVLRQDFRDIAREQAEAIAADMEKYVGPEYADEYRERIRGGTISGTLFTVEKAMGVDVFSESITCASVVKCIAAYQEIGEVSEPLKIEGGYALARLSSAELGALESTWEDQKAFTKDYYVNSEFLKWANGVLSGAEKTY